MQFVQSFNMWFHYSFGIVIYPVESTIHPLNNQGLAVIVWNNIMLEFDLSLGKYF